MTLAPSLASTPAPAPHRALPLYAPRARPGARLPPRTARVSVTDRCDYACTYCRPSHHEEYAGDRLSVADWRTIFIGLRRAGIRRVRLTGGEPLLVPWIVQIVEQASALGFEDIALTTNASQLAGLAAPLRRAGLHRINVSLDSLDPARFAAITRGGRLSDALDGLEAARLAGLSPIKLNTVVLRGVNDDEVERILAWAWARRMLPRFIEVMPIAEGARLVERHLVTSAELRAALAAHLADGDAEPDPELGPAKYLRARRDPLLRVGFISGTSDTFCSACDRLRVSSAGTLRPCLAVDAGVDAGACARSGDATTIASLVAKAWALKPDGDTWRGCAEASAASVSIRAIGG
jgi:GTP 3',8-cyclase